MDIENDIYKNKYLKYKTKYTELKKIDENEEINKSNDYEYNNEGGTVKKKIVEKLGKELKKQASKPENIKKAKDLVSKIGNKKTNNNNECDCCDKCPKQGCIIS